MKTTKAVCVLDMKTLSGATTLAGLVENRRGRDTVVAKTVETIIRSVRKGSDNALFGYARKFDKNPITAATVKLHPESFKELGAQIPSPLKRTIREAARRIRNYHREQGIRSFSLRTADGRLSQIVKPLRRVGLYVPGGFTIYPSSILMNAIPAQIAGVREIAAITPCRGGLDPRLAFVFDILKIREVYALGGAHGVAALAYGTTSVSRVDKIVGPGNAYVAAAKRAVFGDVDIDMVAGPSEVAILADTTSNAEWVALDMLAQAEHGSGDEMAVCITESRVVAKRIEAALNREIDRSPVRAVFERLSKGALCICVTANRRASLELVNQIAPEHLEIMTRNPQIDLKGIDNAGAVFLGKGTPVAMGDYFVGTNHVLPTGSSARFASPLGVDDFQKRISVAEVSTRAFRACAEHVSRFARAEGFVHHALSVERR